MRMKSVSVVFNMKIADAKNKLFGKPEVWFVVVFQGFYLHAFKNKKW